MIKNEPTLRITIVREGDPLEGKAEGFAAGCVIWIFDFPDGFRATIPTIGLFPHDLADDYSIAAMFDRLSQTEKAAEHFI